MRLRDACSVVALLVHENAPQRRRQVELDLGD